MCLTEVATGKIVYTSSICVNKTAVFSGILKLNGDIDISPIYGAKSSVSFMSLNTGLRSVLKIVPCFDVRCTVLFICCITVNCPHYMLDIT